MFNRSCWHRLRSALIVPLLAATITMIFGFPMFSQAADAVLVSAVPDSLSAMRGRPTSHASNVHETNVFASIGHPVELTSQPGTALATGAEGLVLAFSDEFDNSALDTAKWNTQHWFPWGVGNGEVQYYKDTDAHIMEHGLLRLKATKETVGERNYTSAMVTSFDKFSQQYGYWEIRARVPKGAGLWPAIWMLKDTQVWDWTKPEVDIMEFLGNIPNMVSMGRLGADGKNHYEVYYADRDFSDGFHTYAMDWRPTRITWYVDGVERSSTISEPATGPMYLIINLAVGGKGPGDPDLTTPWPSYFDIDYVRVYADRRSTPQL